MTETPKYSVIKKQNEIELSRYPVYIQAEVSIIEKGYKSGNDQRKKAWKQKVILLLPDTIVTPAGAG